MGNWSETLLYSFQGANDGWAPYNGPLIFDQVGNIYGTTTHSGYSGTVYELVPTQGSWTKNILYSFTGGSDGAGPLSELVFDTTGNLYGTTYMGGLGFGTVYELQPSGSGWIKTTLYNFQGSTDGRSPIGGLIIDQSGNPFGTTPLGGAGGGGTIYELSPTRGGWAFTTIYAFTGNFFEGPTDSLSMDADGNLYGATFSDGHLGRGSVFKLAPSNGGWTSYPLYDFLGGNNDGEYPYGGVALDASGNLYGTTVNGGAHNYGVVWQITPQTLATDHRP